MKKCSILILIMLSIITQVSARDFAAAEKAGFKFSADRKTLLKCPNNITVAVIPSGVTTIGEDAFANCYNLTRVTIPNSVTTIGKGAFSHCYKLTRITLPNSVTSIGDSAFWFCRKLSSVTIPSGVTAIREGTFGYCSNLTRVIIPNTVKSIGNGAFVYSNLTSVFLPYGVTTIKAGAFEGCSNVTRVTIPNSVTSIEKFAFSGCYRLPQITIPDSVTSIGDGAFSSRSVKVSIGNPCFVNGVAGEVIDIKNERLIYFPRSYSGSYRIPDTVTSIGNGVFYSCTCLTRVTIPDSVTSIGDSAFEACNVTQLNIPSSVTSIGEGAFVTIPSVKISAGNRCFVNGAAGEVIDIKNKRLIYFPQSYSGSYRIPDSVTTIGDKAFFCCKKLTRITIPDGVTAIGGDAFLGCENLTQVTLPDSVTSIGRGAFYDCKNLTRATLGAQARYSEYNASTESCSSFPPGCKIIRRKNVSDKDTSSAAGFKFSEDQKTLLHCPRDIVTAVIPPGVTTIGNGAFANCKHLEQVTIPDSVTSIEDMAFYACLKLNNVKIPNSVTTIGRGAFAACWHLTKVTIPNSVTSIGDLAFANCPLKQVVIGPQTRYYHKSTFPKNCKVFIRKTVSSENIGRQRRKYPNR